MGVALVPAPITSALGCPLPCHAPNQTTTSPQYPSLTPDIDLRSSMYHPIFDI